MAKKTVKITFKSKTDFQEISVEKLKDAQIMIKSAMKDAVKTYERNEAGSKVYASRTILNA